MFFIRLSLTRTFLSLILHSCSTRVVYSNKSLRLIKNDHWNMFTQYFYHISLFSRRATRHYFPHPNFTLTGASSITHVPRLSFPAFFFSRPTSSPPAASSASVLGRIPRVLRSTSSSLPVPCDWPRVSPPSSRSLRVGSVRVMKLCQRDDGMGLRSVNPFVQTILIDFGSFQYFESTRA